jgi:hypothetical protein
MALAPALCRSKAGEEYADQKLGKNIICKSKFWRICRLEISGICRSESLGNNG